LSNAVTVTIVLKSVSGKFSICKPVAGDGNGQSATAFSAQRVAFAAHCHFYMRAPDRLQFDCGGRLVYSYGMAPI